MEKIIKMLTTKVNELRRESTKISDNIEHLNYKLKKKNENLVELKKEIVVWEDAIKCLTPKTKEKRW